MGASVPMAPIQLNSRAHGAGGAGARGYVVDLDEGSLGIGGGDTVEKGGGGGCSQRDGGAEAGQGVGNGAQLAVEGFGLVWVEPRSERGRGEGEGVGQRGSGQDRRRRRTVMGADAHSDGGEEGVGRVGGGGAEE